MGVAHDKYTNYTKELNKNNRINATIGVEESLSRSYIMRQTAEGLTFKSMGWKDMMSPATSNPDPIWFSNTSMI